VQLPLPDHINETKVIQSINPNKDVDGFTLYNIGLMQLGEPCYLPATPFGIMELLKRSNVEIAGKHIVVMGRSNIVGTPVSVMLSRKGVDATVTMCHSKTQNLKELTRQADILIVAIGQAEYVKADMVKEGAVVIDVGIHRIKDDSEKGYHIVGDVDYKEVYKVASKITPVPGGVGPMTIVSLLYNTLQAAKNNKK
jgi:methylenetetrahydrofolate dehydrogenase (NADP+)/methenyltetrahydrofolate cyclohydrolase